MQCEFSEGKRIISALAVDERMEAVWDAIRNWTDFNIAHLVQSAFLFAHPIMLTDLTHPPERRVQLGGPNFDLSSAAEHLANTIKKNMPQAADLWPESIEGFLQKLREFSQKQFARGLGLWSSTERIPTPSRRGRGDRSEIAYGNAMADCLEAIGALSRDKRDEIIAVLTNVVFGRSPSEEVDPDRIRARRKRKQRASRASRR